MDDVFFSCTAGIETVPAYGFGCAAAGQLRVRGLRGCSGLPDWFAADSEAVPEKALNWVRDRFETPLFDAASLKSEGPLGCRRSLRDAFRVNRPPSDIVLYVPVPRSGTERRTEEDGLTADCVRCDFDIKSDLSSEMADRHFPDGAVFPDRIPGAEAACLNEKRCRQTDSGPATVRQWRTRRFSLCG